MPRSQSGSPHGVADGSFRRPSSDRLQSPSTAPQRLLAPFWPALASPCLQNPTAASRASKKPNADAEKCRTKAESHLAALLAEKKDLCRNAHSERGWRGKPVRWSVGLSGLLDRSNHTGLGGQVVWSGISVRIPDQTAHLDRTYDCYCHHYRGPRCYQYEPEGHPRTIEPKGYRGQHNLDGNDRGQHNPDGLDCGQLDLEGLCTAAQAVAARARLSAYEGRCGAFGATDGSPDLSVPGGLTRVQEAYSPKTPSAVIDGNENCQ